MKARSEISTRRGGAKERDCPARKERDSVGAIITLRGVVQGVGFRPFVHRLARECQLAGTVKNFSGGVIIEVEGSPGRVQEFYDRVSAQAPPLAQVVDKQIQMQQPRGLKTFSLLESTRLEDEFVLVPADISLCQQCQAELLDPRDRRYRYPFINCTDCGPRFTIIKGMPYDRPMTTMRAFTMCSPCQEEYGDIDHRRYHAQPNACPDCGPHLFLRDKHGKEIPGEDALKGAVARLKGGQILAVKGIGGFHLCCDAADDQAVLRLRQRKNRPVKPLAIMSLDAARVGSYCRISTAEKQLLESPMRPIVVLSRREGTPISPQVAPGNNTLGVMLPYAPVHVLLLEDLLAMVATSANLSDRPLISDNEEALRELPGIVDAFLLHDRDIHARCDDSIWRIVDGVPLPLRRARGYAPMPVKLPFETPAVLACGAELKNTFCLTRGTYAFLSQHIGDLKNMETYAFYQEMIQHFESLFRIRPRILAHDLHPQYLSTRYADQLAAREDGLTTVAVQHHHAHVAACMADNGIDEPVIGVVFDGLGYGADGNIWGAEFMVADYEGYQRRGQLRYVPLPGGDAANREPWRMGLSYLHALYGSRLGAAQRALFEHLDPAAVEAILRMLDRGYNAPLASSMGRLFDTVASLLGLCQHSTFEGEAAVRLQVAAERADQEPSAYSWSIALAGEYLTADPRPMIRDILGDIGKGVPAPQIALRFHRAVAELVRAGCGQISRAAGLTKVALSGGVFQNKLLAGMVVDLLRREGLEPLVHHQVPPNDGGIALGQAAIAGHKTRER